MEGEVYAFEAIGTTWKITVPGGMSEDTLAEIRERISLFDKNYSRFRADSWVAEIARTSGTYTVPDDGKSMFDLYQDLYKLTEGAMTPLIGDVLIAAGYDAAYSLTPKEMRPAYEWEEALEYAYPSLVMYKPTMLDFGAMGKGYLVDLVSDILKARSVSSFVINAGGDICVYSKVGESVRIALENPSAVTEAIGIAEITNLSICGSAGNRRVWDRFTHIIDPDTLQSPKAISAIWVVANTTLLSDALTTALYFAPAEKLRIHYSFDYLLLRADHTVERSLGFPAELLLS